MATVTDKGDYIADLLRRMRSDAEVETELGRTKQESFDAHREAEKLDREELVPFLQQVAVGASNQYSMLDAYFSLCHIAKNTGNLEAARLLLGAAIQERRNYAKAILLGYLSRLDLPAELKDQALELAHTCVRHKHWHVRSAAVELVGKVGSLKSVPLLLQELASKDKFHLANVISALRSCGNMDYVDRVLPFMNYPVADVAWCAVSCIADWGKMDSTPYLVEALETSKLAKHTAMSHLNSFGDGSAVVPVMKRVRKLFANPPKTRWLGGESERVLGTRYLLRFPNHPKVQTVLKEIRGKWLDLMPEEKANLTETPYFADLPT